MDHAEAIKMGAVERYMLADLSVSEVEEFERHFFDCPQCSEELRTLSILRENARAVFIENSTPSIAPVSAPAISLPEPVTLHEPAADQTVIERPFIEQPAVRTGLRITWPRLFAPALAMLAVAAFLGYQAGERKTGEPQSVNAYPLYAASRGAEIVVAPPAGAQFFTLYMDRTWDTDFASYRAVVHDESQAGAERASMPLPAPLPGRVIQVLFPAHALPAGRYTLTILGKDSSGRESKAADYSFTLRFQ
jgi:hypothetical protein